MLNSRAGRRLGGVSGARPHSKPSTAPRPHEVLRAFLRGEGPAVGLSRVPGLGRGASRRRRPISARCPQPSPPPVLTRVLSLLTDDRSP